MSVTCTGLNLIPYSRSRLRGASCGCRYNTLHSKWVRCRKCEHSLYNDAAAGYKEKHNRHTYTLLVQTPPGHSVAEPPTPSHRQLAQQAIQALVLLSPLKVCSFF